MHAVSRRITALKRVSARRERMEAELRGELEARRREQVDLQSRVEESTATLGKLDAIAAHHHARIADMMSGSEKFSIDVFDGCRRYLEVVNAQILDAQSELNARRQEIVANDKQIAAARRAIAQNRGRIDICRKRSAQLERTLDQIKLDAEDDAAEELALVRRRPA